MKYIIDPAVVIQILFSVDSSQEESSPQQHRNKIQDLSKLSSYYCNVFSVLLYVYHFDILASRYVFRISRCINMKKNAIQNGNFFAFW